MLANHSYTNTHLIILRASRLESLVSPLMTALAEHRPDNVLAPQTVIAAHPGMKQWLAGAMAREAGSGGIVANIEVLLPGAWLGKVAAECLGDPALALPAWQRKVLRWSLFRALDPAHGFAGLRDPRITRYLAASQTLDEAEQARRRFQLADRLAGTFAQYLVYRSDWLRAWESGLDGFATAHLQDAAAITLERDLFAPLWRHLVAQLGPHRAVVIDQLVGHLDRHAEYPTPLHVFGFSHLPPGEQQVLHAWARHAPVYLYLPDPCREFWGGLARVETRAVDFQRLRDWRDDETRRIDAADGGDWLDQDQAHPLLARWGRLGQHFYASLADWEALADIRDHQDIAPPAPQDRLARVQESIRRLDRDTLREASPFPLQSGPDESAETLTTRQKDWWLPRRADASLRVHACHTRVRELEVLRDALLDAVNAGIAPGSMVVMAPDIGAYAALLPSIFGAAGDARERHLPWHLADASISRRHRLFTLLARLLDLGSSRITTPEIADLLAVPEIARALDLTPSAHSALLDWLAASRAAWALDAKHRESFGVPGSRPHTQAWAMDRMVAGYLMADEDNDAGEHAITLPDGDVLLPLSGIHGPDSTAVAALDRLLCELQAWRELSNSTRPASQWRTVLDTRLGALLDIDTQDAQARAAWDAIRSMIGQLANEPAQAGDDPHLHFSVVRELLAEALDSVPEYQRFLMGGVTFCGMVPQRAIPFDMVCVLGLDDGQFPRRRRDGGIDLMARLRRIGDRDTRSDDRWLFLETLMSARRRLHLSWLGCGARDGKPRNPAAPLAELLDELDHAAAVAGLPDDAHARPWLIRHPLQPFDARYFAGDDPALFSHSPAFSGMHGAGDNTPPGFLDGPPLPPDPLPQPLSLAAVSRYWKAPAQELLQRRLKLELDAEGSHGLPDSEPLDARFAAIDSIARRVFFREALPAGFDDQGKPHWNPNVSPDWIRHGGYLPPGELAEAAWAPEAQAVLALLDAARRMTLPATHAERIEVDIALPGFIESAPAFTLSGTSLRLCGPVQNVFAHRDGGWQIVQALPRPVLDKNPALKPADELDIGKRLALFLEWAALRLHTNANANANASASDDAESTPPRVRLTLLADGASSFATQLAAWDEAFIQRPEARATMRIALEERLSRLIHIWWHAGAQPPLYFPAAAQAALTAHQQDKSAADIRKAIVQRFEGGWVPGERDRAPGWNRLLARGIDFEAHLGHPPAWERLLDQATTLEALMQLPVPAAAGAVP